MRGKLAGKGFTINQVYTWLGYMSLNIDKRGIAPDKKRLLLALKVHGLPFYAPFEKD
jgi:hypothetical protein